MSTDKSTMHPSQRIVVTGMGLCSPCGDSIAQFAEVLRTGGTGIRQQDDVFDDATVWAGIVRDFDPASKFSASEMERFDRTAQMGFIAAEKAVQDANFTIDQAPERTALTLGTSHGGRSQLDEFVIGGSQIDDDVPRKLLVTAAHYQQTSAVASKLGVHGATATLSNACSSSGAAIAYAVELLRSGKCDYGIAGGADGFSRLTYSGFSALGAVADAPCAPFSEPVGLSLGDGAAFVILETLEQARERGAKIYAELWGYGLSWDAYHITAPEPSGEGMNRAIRMAIDSSGINSDSVDYVNVHGTGTRSNDLAETVGLQRYFDGLPPPISSTKSQTGHMLGASSSVGLISCIVGMQEGWLPPTSNFTVERSGCEIDAIPNKARPQQISCFMAQSAAFAGANAVLVGGKVRDDRVPPAFEQEEIVISGVGLVSPIGCGFDAFARALEEQQSGISAITEFSTDGCNSSLGGMIRDFKPRKLMPSINLRRVERVAAYATIAASLGMKHAGLWPLTDQAEKTGLIVGVCRGAASSYEKFLASVEGGQWDKASAVHFPNLVMSSIGGQVSASLGIKGITSTLVGSTSAGLGALIHAWELFRRNPHQQAVVVVASDELAPFYYKLFDRLGRLAPGHDPDSSQFSPYSQKSSGMVLGEGSVALVLERSSSVAARGGNSLATLQGSGQTHAARTNAADNTTPESHEWLSRAFALAMQDAECSADSISSIYGAGQGRWSHDGHELAAVEETFGSRLHPQSTTHLTGVCESASSLFQVAAAIAEGQQSNSATRSLITASGEDGCNAAVVLGLGS